MSVVVYGFGTSKSFKGNHYDDVNNKVVPIGILVHLCKQFLQTNIV